MPAAGVPLLPDSRRAKDPDDPGPLDWLFAAIALLVGGYDAFLERQGILSTSDIVAGALLLILVLEAAGRTTGLALPVVCLVFLAYSSYGGYLPQNWDIAHAGSDSSQIVNALYNDALDRNTAVELHPGAAQALGTG